MSRFWLRVLLAGLMALGLTGCATRQIKLKCKTVSQQPGWAPTAVDHLTVRTGDRLKYSVEVFPGVYLYILHVGASGAGQALLPTATGPNARNYVEADGLLINRPVVVPADGWFKVEPPAGTERLIFVAAKHRIAEIDRLLGAGRFSVSEVDRVLDVLASRRPKDYRLEKVQSKNQVKFELYSTEHDPELVGEIELRHVGEEGQNVSLPPQPQPPAPPRPPVSIVPAPVVSAPPAPAPAETRPRVKFWVERVRKGSRDIEYVLDGDSQTFRTGDRVVFKFNANVDCYAYLVNQGPSGQAMLLYPGMSGRDNHVPKGKTRTMPSEKGTFRFDPQAGRERLCLLISPERIAELEGIADESGGPAANLDSRQLRTWQHAVSQSAEMGRSRDLTLQQDSGGGASETPGNYATYTGGGFSQAIAVYMTLRHAP